MFMRKTYEVLTRFRSRVAGRNLPIGNSSLLSLSRKAADQDDRPLFLVCIVDFFGQVSNGQGYAFHPFEGLGVPIRMIDFEPISAERSE